MHLIVFVRLASDLVIDSGFFTTARYVPEQKFKLKKGNALDNTSSEKEIKSVIENISKIFVNYSVTELPEHLKMKHTGNNYIKSLKSS